MSFVCYNHHFYPSATPLLPVQNRGFRYGDGLFETMKVHKGNVMLASLHEERLFTSLRLLGMTPPATMEQLSLQIIELCRMNHCEAAARVRLAVFREEESRASFVIEAVPLSAAMQQWQEEGLTIDIFPHARKSTDAYANLKTANFLPYVMADLFAKERGLDDCIVLNTGNHLCDSSRANVFLFRDGQVFTPALDQGCISGVMRRHVIEGLKRMQLVVHQAALTETDLRNAEEVFLTNAIIGIRWVGSYRQKAYTYGQTASIYQRIISTLYA